MFPGSAVTGGIPPVGILTVNAGQSGGHPRILGGCQDAAILMHREMVYPARILRK
jgi:hypothetical protein